MKASVQKLSVLDQHAQIPTFLTQNPIVCRLNSIRFVK